MPSNEIPVPPTPPDQAVVDDTAGDPIPPTPDLPAGDGEVTPTSRLTAVEDLPILVGPTATDDPAPPPPAKRASGGAALADPAADPVTWDVGVDPTVDATIDAVPESLVISLSTDDLQTDAALSSRPTGAGSAAADDGDDTGDAATRVVLDYSDFAGLWGGGWADRLIVQAMPDCYATTPELEECQSPSVGFPALG